MIDCMDVYPIISVLFSLISLLSFARASTLEERAFERDLLRMMSKRTSQNEII